MLEQTDRISYSFGMKINIGNYQSVDFHLSMSTDVKPNETEAEAMDRAKAFIEATAEREYEEYSKLKE